MSYQEHPIVQQQKLP